MEKNSATSLPIFLEDSKKIFFCLNTENVQPKLTSSLYSSFRSFKSKLVFSTKVY